MVNYYVNWLEKKGSFIEVEPLEFLGMVLNHKYPRRYNYNDKKYYCERYLVQSGDNTFEARFRIDEKDYIKPTREEIGWGYTKISEAIRDDVPNYHIDSINYVLSGDKSIYTPYEGKKHENFHLKIKNKKEAILRKILRKLIKKTESKIFIKGLKSRLFFQTNPCYKTKRKFRKFKKEFPTYDYIINEWVKHEVSNYS